MNKLLYILIFLLSLFSSQQDYYNKKNKPSTWGIDQYVIKQHDSIIFEYEYLINDTIYDVAIYSEDLREYSDDNNLGFFYIPDEIVITNEERYIEYEFKDLSRFKRLFLSYTERTVKAVIFHELTHAYFHQIVELRNMNNEFVSPEYKNFNIFPRVGENFGADFIEEGICEYTVYTLNECAPLGHILIPKTEEELLHEDNRINNLYHYSVYFLRDFMDEYGIKRGIEILISNRPPTHEEILNSDKFFNRLKIN